MDAFRSPRLRSRNVRIAAATLTLVLVGGGLAACSATSASSGSSAGSGSSTETTDASGTAATTASGFWSTSTVHDIALTAGDAELKDALATYADTGEKVWVSASVTIDGVEFANVGLKLKGNSTLRGTDADSDPSTLPWLIRLDEFVDGQTLDGDTEFVVRANNMETSLNEAVSLSLLAQAGLATELAASSRFTINGGTTELRLVIQNPSDEWDAANFDSAGLLYKAESGGDYSYRGDDPDAYADVFDQEAGDDDLAPLIDFLQFVNESDDATFAADLSQHLDVQAFATYLAFQDLVQNGDDIDGPGNNSYLRYDSGSGVMTVVNWDLNGAFGMMGRGAAGGAGGAAGGQQGGGGRPAGGGQDADGAGGGARGGNILSERFLANADFAALVAQAKTDLTATLFTSGAAQQLVDDWAAVLTAQASDLVSADTIASEAAALSAKFPS